MSPEVFDDFSDWVITVRKYVFEREPALIPFFDKYANEARFGRHWLAPDVVGLPKGAAILEVGAGIMLLSCHLAREGFAVTALEPISEGFSQFEKVRSYVMECARRDGIKYNLLECSVEQLEARNSFDLAFSVNVMEHVASVDMALKRIVRSLQPNGIYRFTCPNYQFPYEPHFNLPTFFSKPLTESVLRRVILNSRRIAEPQVMWNSLNWIGVRQVRQICAALPGVSVRFYTNMIGETLERTITDREFADRRSPWIVSVARFLVSIGAHRYFVRLPAGMQPILDCEISMVGHSKPISG